MKSDVCCNVHANFTSLFLILLFVCCVAGIRRRYFSPLASIPGPAWASVTRLWHIYYILRGDHNTRLVQLHEKYGHFVRIAPNEVSVSHPEGPKLLLQQPLRKANWYRTFALPDYRYQTPQSTLNPEEKTRRSKLFASGLTLSQLLCSREYYDSNIGFLFDWMDRYSREQRPMHLDKFFTFVGFDNAGEALFSQSLGFIEQGRDIGHSVRNSRSLNLYMCIVGYYYWLHLLFVGNPLVTRLGLLPVGHVHKTAMEAMQRRNGNHDARYDTLSHWLRTHRENTEQLTYRDIQAQLTVSVAAGSDTLSCVLQAFTYFMIRHPESWKRARDEIYESQKHGRCHGRVISYQDSQTLPYVAACIYEAVRMFGPGPFGLPRVVPRGGIRIGNASFPLNTILSINPQVMQVSTDCWGEDAKEWRPERWLGSGQGMSSKYQYWLAFGLGLNRCPGEHLANIQIFKICTTIVRDYDIVQVNAGQKWKWKAYFTVVPHSWPVYIHKSRENRD